MPGKLYSKNCHYFLRGYCKYGEDCFYSHPPDKHSRLDTALTPAHAYVPQTKPPRARSDSEASDKTHASSVLITTSAVSRALPRHVYIVIQEANLPIHAVYPETKYKTRNRNGKYGALHSASFEPEALHSRDIQGTYYTLGGANKKVLELQSAESGTMVSGTEPNGRNWWERRLWDNNSQLHDRCEYKIEVRIEKWEVGKLKSSQVVDAPIEIENTITPIGGNPVFIPEVMDYALESPPDPPSDGTIKYEQEENKGAPEVPYYHKISRPGKRQRCY